MAQGADSADMFLDRGKDFVGKQWLLKSEWYAPVDSANLTNPSSQ